MKKPALLILTAILVLSCSNRKIPLYKNPKAPIEERVEDLLSRMTLEEKVSQIYPLRITDTLAWDKEGNFVSQDTARLYLGIGAFWAGHMRLLPAEMRAKCINSIQQYLVEKSRLGIPANTFAEGLHGYMAPGATSFPQAIALGCTWDTVLLEKIYTATSLEASSSGITQFLSPVIDVARDPRWGRTEECFSEDPYLVARLGLAAVYGFQGRGEFIDRDHAVVTLKHFAGHGQPEGGRNIAPVNYSERYFRQTHLYPFEVAVKQGNAQSIMVSYNEWDGVPNHINHKLLTDILRTEWGFNGYVMSDGGGLDVTWRNHLAAKDSAEAGILAILAGVDYDLGSTGCFTAMGQHVSDSLVPDWVLDNAVRNILRVKFISGLFEQPYVDVSRVNEIINCAEHQELALEAAHKSAVLLKNDSILPLDTLNIKTLAVIGPNAADIHLGGYSWPEMKGVSVLEGFRNYGEKHNMEILYSEGCKITLNQETHWLVNEEPVMSTPEIDKPLIAEAIDIAKKSDAVVLVLGENELINREAWSELHEGDVDHLKLAGSQLELAESIIATGKPVVVILINGRPLAVNYLAENAPALIEAWYLGQETGTALTNLIFGEENFSGKLAITFPRNVGQIPCFYNHQPSRFREYVNADASPLFPFGHGLSYSKYAYSKLKIDKYEMKTSDSLKVSIHLENKSNYSGEEIVQLYIHDLVSVPVRPVLELKDFARIGLRPGEKKQVEFILTPEKFEALDLNMEMSVQPGEYAIMVGRSSVDFVSDTVLIR